MIRKLTLAFSMLTCPSKMEQQLLDYSDSHVSDVKHI